MRDRRGAWLVAALIWLSIAAVELPTAAQPPRTSTGDTAGVRSDEQVRTNLQLRLVEARARLDVLSEEQALLSTSRAARRDVRLTASPELYDSAVTEDLRQRTENGKNALLRQYGEIGSENEIAELQREAKRKYTEVSKHCGLLRANIAEFNSQLADRPSGPWDWSNRSLRSLGLGLVAGGLILTLHECRDRVRWVLRGLASRPGRSGVNWVTIAMIYAIAQPFHAAAVDSADLYREITELQALLDSPEPAARERVAASLVNLVARVAEVERRVTVATSELDRSIAEYRKSQATFGLLRSNDEQERRANSIIDGTARLQELYRDLMIKARTTELLADATLRLDGQARAEASKCVQAAKEVRNLRSSEHLTKLGICIGLLAGVTLPLGLARARRGKQLDEQRRMCPRCLEKGTLQLVAYDETPEERRPKYALTECSLCKFEIRENYLAQNRLCFPTVGIRASGKTHWMVVLYDLIKNANVPVASDLQKIPSREDERFDQLVRQLLYERGLPAPSVLSLPYPLTFHVHDADRFGRNKTMVNLFDFAGEIRELRIDLDLFRQRALLCEGFTFFLDPTQVTPGSGFDIEDQIQTIERFANDLHAMHRVPTEKPVHLPVAVCISKFDLLVTQNPIAAQAHELVAELRSTLGMRPTLGLIHQRSHLCARVIPLMFPGWNVEGVLRRNFGGRYMFFPVSSIGLEASELGIDDRTNRTIAPFGVLEPLLWLLHMHGYKIFS
jgi:hypothetical protein